MKEMKEKKEDKINCSQLSTDKTTNSTKELSRNIIRGIYGQSCYSGIYTPRHCPEKWLIDIMTSVSDVLYRYPDLKAEWLPKLLLTDHRDFMKKYYPGCHELMDKCRKYSRILEAESIRQLKEFEKTQVAEICNLSKEKSKAGNPL